MDKREILKEFLRKGIMLSPEDLEKMNSENYKQILEGKGEEEQDITIETPKKENISCKDYVRKCNQKFEFLKELLLKKTEAVSINKGKKVFSEVAVIGRVKDLTAKGFIIEDVTGETEVVSEYREVSLGEVIGLKGRFRENSFHPTQIIWPDIPLGNKPEKPWAKMMFTTKTDDFEGMVLCPGGKEKDNAITGFEKIGIIKLSDKGRQFIVIAYSPGKETSEEAAVKTLKKRFMENEEGLDTLIKETPNVFWIYENKRNWTKNYKGVVIISTDKDSFAEYGAEAVKFGKI